MVKHLGPGVIEVDLPWNTQESWERWFLLVSDVHYDSVDCNRTLLKKHLDLAVKRNAGILSIGDMFDLVGGKGDPRRSKDEIRPEYLGGEYIDLVLNDTAEFLAPYAQYFTLLSQGNHELSIRSHMETDVTERLAERLRLAGSPVKVGGYNGWGFFKTYYDAGKTTGKRRKVMLHYMHGAGGGGAVTKGIPASSRRAVYLPDADIITSGHIHEAWHVEIPRERITVNGRVFKDDQTHLCLGTYADHYNDRRIGYHHQSERGPKPQGGWWLRFYLEYEKAHEEANSAAVVRCECIRAK